MCETSHLLIKTVEILEEYLEDIKGLKGETASEDLLSKKNVCAF